MADLKPLFDKNAALFTAKHAILGKIDFNIVWASLTDAELAALADGLQKNRWLYKGKLLHSERDPAREAARAAETYREASAVICVSAGAGYLFAALPASVRQVLLVENDFFCLAAFILSDVFTAFHGSITLFAEPLDRPDALEEILPWLQGKNLKRTLIYCHAPLIQIDKPRVTRTYERVVQLFEKRSVNQATIVKFQQLWNKNIFLNRRAMAASGSMKTIWDVHPPEAIVLAGAGPSLAESYADLKQNRKLYILFAADTALIPLAKAGVYPDFVFSADPQWLNHFFAQSAAAAKSVWVMDPVVCPAIPRFVQHCGAQTLFWNNVFLADTHFRLEDRGDVAHGGSVSTNAFDVAVAWLYRRSAGQGRLILVGQDLSFSNRQAHTKGAVLEAQVYARSHRLRTMEQHNLAQMKAMPVVWQRGIRQEKVRTNGKLKIFHDWFEARAADTNKQKIRLVNATADGARLNGFEHLPLAEALQGVTPQEAPAVAIRVTGTIKPAGDLLGRLSQVQKLMHENEKLAREKNPAAAQIEKLNRNDAEFKSLGFAKEIVALNAQALILKITEQGEDVDAPEFYGAMRRAARAIRHWANKVI
ncbi:MAG: motility associated factor glycosyltransferase family protein [Spirochaetes bacterium]|nr:motility associated factor glycosyltransferase family protein [Spirochaetota bacterium]